MVAIVGMVLSVTPLTSAELVVESAQLGLFAVAAVLVVQLTLLAWAALLA